MLAFTSAINVSGSDRAHASACLGTAKTLAVSRLLCFLAVAGSAFGQSPVWTLRSSGGPSARHAHALAYDSARGRVVVFGGLSGSTRLDDIWEWDGTSWTEKHPDAPTPSARHSHAMAYDSARGMVVLFGGNASGREADTWEWDGTSWNSLGVTPAPYSRYGHSMVYDASRGVSRPVWGLRQPKRPA